MTVTKEGYMRTLSKLLLLIIFSSLLSGCWYLNSQVKLEPKKGFHDYTADEFDKLAPAEKRRLWREFDREIRELERKVGMN